MFLSAVRQLRLATLWLLLLGGCATQTDELKQQLREAGDRQHRTEARLDRMEERVSALELAHRALSNRSKPPMESLAMPPDLPLVKMTPGKGSADIDAADSGSDSNEPRTLIVGEGAKVESKMVNDSPTVVPPKRNKDKANVDSAKKPSLPLDNGNKAQ